MSFLAGPLEGKEQMVRFHLHRKSLLMLLASCYIWCCVNCIFVGCELLCRGASRRIFPVGISQPLSRSLEYWNIWNIEIFGIFKYLEYLEHWNIATTIKLSGILKYLKYWNIWNIERFGTLKYRNHYQGLPATSAREDEWREWTWRILKWRIQIFLHFQTTWEVEPTWYLIKNLPLWRF